MQIFAVQYVLAVKPDSPFRTLADLVNAAKAKPGDVKYGYGGVATNPHLAMSQLVLTSGMDVLPFPTAATRRRSSRSRRATSTRRR